MVKVKKAAPKKTKDKAGTLTQANLWSILKGQLITFGSIFIGGVILALQSNFNVDNNEALIGALGTLLGNTLINAVREYKRSDR